MQAMGLWPLPGGLLVSAAADGAGVYTIHLLAHPLDELKRVSFANGGTIPVQPVVLRRSRKAS